MSVLKKVVTVAWQGLIRVVYNSGGRGRRGDLNILPLGHVLVWGYLNILSIKWCTTFYFVLFYFTLGSISFFSSSDTHQSYHLFGCHAEAINSFF